MKHIFHLIIIISLFTLSCGDCGEENVLTPEEDDGIAWEQITGKFAYLSGNALYLLDANLKSVKSLGATNLTNLKWNKTISKITGIRLIDDSTYSLEGIDLNGNHSVINNSLFTMYYDWLPDGSLVTFSKDNKLIIDGIILLDQTFDPLFGLACSPDGEKIVVSTDNILENYLLEIDINSLEQSIIERNSNIFDPNLTQLVYSLESNKVVYATFAHEPIGDDKYYRIWITTKILLGAGKDPCRSDNLQRILYTNVNWYTGRTIGVYSINIDGGDSVELIEGAHTPIWIY